MTTYDKARTITETMSSANPAAFGAMMMVWNHGSVMLAR